MPAVALATAALYAGEVAAVAAFNAGLIGGSAWAFALTRAAVAAVVSFAGAPMLDIQRRPS